MLKNILFFFLLITSGLKAQSVLFNSDGGTPDESAIMEVRSTEKGILIPRMEESNRLSIPSPAQGLLVFQTNGSIGFYYYNGTAWDTLGGASSVTYINNVTNIFNSGIAVLRDVKPGGSNGGTFTSGSWQTRDLNDIDGDTSFVSLNGNEFTLDSGIYVISINAPAYEVATHQCRLYNVTENTIEAYGNVSYADKFSHSKLVAVVNVRNPNQTFRVEHHCSITKSAKGFGEGISWGENTFTQVEIEQL